jgi:hypothetical protein
MVVDPRNFLLSSTYPIDKISGYYTGSTTVGALSLSSPTVTHGLGYAPLYFLKWSTTADFSTSYDELGVSAINNLSMSAQTSSTTLYLFLDNNTGSSVTFYYRVIYFMPTDINIDAPATQPALDSLVLNTEFNYTKIFEENILNAASGTIDHDLGYYPQVEAWYVRSSDSRIVHCVANQVEASPTLPRTRITTTQVLFDDGSSTAASSWHYKIYADEV